MKRISILLFLHFDRLRNAFYHSMEKINEFNFFSFAKYVVLFHITERKQVGFILTGEIFRYTSFYCLREMTSLDKGGINYIGTMTLLTLQTNRRRVPFTFCK